MTIHGVISATGGRKLRSDSIDDKIRWKSTIAADVLFFNYNYSCALGTFYINILTFRITIFMETSFFNYKCLNIYVLEALFT